MGVLALVGAAAVVVAAAYLARTSTTAPTPASIRPARTATLFPTRSPAYPLKVGPTRRYLVDRNDRPFLIVGDSPQALIAKLSPRASRPFLG